MADSCGQVNAASIASAQFHNLSAAAQLSKDGRKTQQMLPTMQPVIPNLSHDFAQMTLQSPGMQINQQTLPASVLTGGINQSWGAASQHVQPQPQQLMQTVPQQHNPALLQQHFQQQQQHQHAMVLRQQQLAQQQHAQQQQQQQQQQMFFMQQQQQQQMILQQQQQQHQIALATQQEMALATQKQQHQQPQQNQVQNDQSLHQAPSSTIILGAVPTTSQSQSIFEQLRNQETQQQEAETQENVTELEEPVISSDISQYLHNNFEQMFHASQSTMTGGLSSSTIDQMATSANEKWKNSKFVHFMQRYQRGELEFTDNDVIERDFDEFAGTNDLDEMNDDQTNEQLWSGLLDEAQDEEGYEGDDWQQDWVEHWKNNIQLPDGYEALQAKIHENIRKYTEEPSLGTFERGVELFDKGDIQQAIALFEHVVHHDEQHSNAWMYLGKSFAQLDQDLRAIECLERCLTIDAYNLNALLMLGVSLSNSFDRPTAVTHLFHWITYHPDFAGLVDTSVVEGLLQQIEEEGPLEALSTELNLATIKMFVDAVKINDQDAESQTVLGVLYHIDRDFQNSIAAFTAAVKLQPNNPELWNKLGAAISNGNRHEDAVRFYAQALQLRPNYLRAQINCATAYYNLKAYHKAYPVFLNAIFGSSDSKFSKTPQPHLWPLLRQCFAMCQLPALAEAAMMRDIDLLKTVMDENGMSVDGDVKPEFPQPLRWE